LHSTLLALDTPPKIQDFLDRIAYSADPIYRSPLSALRDRKAHCFDGALLATCALWAHGDPPLIVDLRAHNDDDHVIAVFRRHRHWGAIAKSNTTVLRYREPVYRSLRELVMSYFDFYYNLNGDKALRDFSGPVDLRKEADPAWPDQDPVLDALADRLNVVPHERLLTDAMIAGLSKVAGVVYDAGLLGSNADGLYKPKAP
jgi:hypothetical protein